MPWEDLAVQVLQQGAKLADGLGPPPQPRETLGGRVEQRFGVGAAVEQREHVEISLRFEAGAFDAQLVHGRLDVRKPAEIDADGGASRGGLGPGGGAQVLDRLPGFREVFFEARPIRVRPHLLQFAPAERAGDIARQQLAQRFEFQNFSAGFQRGFFPRAPLTCGARYLYFPRSRKAFSITASVPSVISSSADRAGAPIPPRRRRRRHSASRRSTRQK